MPKNISTRHLFQRHIAQTSPEPLLIEVDNAQGLYVYDTSGKRYLDLISGINVSNLGHRHPDIVHAIQQQLDQYLHVMVFGETVQGPQVQLAETLVGSLPATLDNVYFVNSGSEAIEAAMKLAKRFTKRKKIIAFRNAYHGSTHGPLSLISDKSYTDPFQSLLPDIELLDFNDISLKGIDKQTAAVIMEPVQGEAGIIKANAEFMHAVRDKCAKTGALLILDEIQTGLGRTGKLFAFEHYGITPDILCLAKSLGGGLPLGAMISAQKIMQTLTHDPALGHITTFGGNALCCAAALAHINYIKQHRLYNRVKALEDIFINGLTHPAIEEVRTAGLMIAVEFKNAAMVKKVIAQCLERGLLTDWFLWNEQSLRIAPPLIISASECEQTCDIIKESVEAAISG